MYSDLFAYHTCVSLLFFGGQLLTACLARRLSQDVQAHKNITALSVDRADII